MSTEDIIAEALGVHTAGQEPRHTAEEYEGAIIAVARLEQRPSENIAQAAARVAGDGTPEVAALMFAANRVRDREAAVGKSNSEHPMSSNLTTILSEAERVSKGATPTVTRDRAESAMLDLAKAEARPGETPCAAFARLCESDERMQKLYALGHAADVAEEQAVVQKGVSGDDRFDRLLVDLAKMRKRAGETVEQAAARLLTTDETVMSAWASTQGL